MADVFENDTQTYPPGMMATVTLPQGRKLRARVSDVLPQIDPATRTFKLRLEADNPDFVLRPDMFVDIRLTVRLPTGLSIPADALVDSGLTKRVYVESGPGIFQPREVETGWRFGDRIQIVRGIHAGDRVVSAGTFLVDSESKLEASAAQNSETPMIKPSDATLDSAQQMMLKVKLTEASPGMVNDPRCGMEVDPSKAVAAAHAFTYRGKTYYFCSRDCQDEFKKSPEKYISASHEMAGAR